MSRTETPAERHVRESVRPEKPFARFRWTVTVVVLGVFLWSTLTVDAAWGRLLQAPERAWTFLVLVIENASLAPLLIALEDMWISVAIAWIATIIGVVLSFPLIFLAAYNLVPRWIVQPVRQVLNVFRAIPEIALAIAFVPFFGLDPVTAALAMGISSIGTLGKLSAEIVEDIDRGPLEAVEASGGGWLSKVRWGVLPQAMPEIAAFWLYRFEINVRVSAVLGVIGMGGIGTFVQEAMRFNDYERIGLGLVVVVVVTILIDTVSSALRRRLIAGVPVSVDAKRQQIPDGTSSP
ncbi:phosphonate ABC transporter, permease protein PhnE [Egibacter rhizosphaerae]|uniref:Phosphonate ABC transporter, permease protein PhnE n=1 Tax=Egibacter rhizosphaerae TaxID=1670831 RepID=A0A411YDP5_9ACTN|nr:phosphonate ABC transporter, permease protein PhnE [Egibacter rhizosphaerae]QBI19318.1 phosphonate ABC transporter, permease protein PhnE [Egibacter rhizosphaerae]